MYDKGQNIRTVSLSRLAYKKKSMQLAQIFHLWLHGFYPYILHMVRRGQHHFGPLVLHNQGREKCKLMVNCPLVFDLQVLYNAVSSRRHWSIHLIFSPHI